MPRQALKAAFKAQPYPDPRPRTRGRPVTYRQEIADEICNRMAQGESLRQICRDEHMPPNPTVMEWVRDNRGADEENGRSGFAEQYTRAREFGCDSIAEEILEFGLGDLRGTDGYIDNGEVQRLRLLSENRKWFLSKLMPKRYGDKVTQEITGSDGSQLVTRIELIPVEPRRNGPEIEHDEGAEVGMGKGGKAKP